MATTVLGDMLADEPVLDVEARERLAVRALRCALLLGVAGDLLLRGGGLGINALLVTLLVAGTVWALDRDRGDGATRARLPLLVPVVGAGIALAWRDSAPLSLAAILSFVVGVALHAAALRAGPSWSLWHLDAAAPLRALLRLAADGATQAGMLLARDVPASAATGTTGWRSVAAGWRGMLVAVPILLVFNALLMSADPIWAKQAERLIDVDFSELFGHLMAIAVLAWLAGGWLRGALLAPAGRATPAPAAERALRTVDVLVPMTLVNLLFAGFVALQLRTLVGGAAYVRDVAGLTYAEYARRGFFELVLVAALTLPALLVADAMTPLDHRARRSVRRASAMTLALLGGILASAAARMSFYLDAYGLTEDRFYASVAMVWLALVLAWFAATVLRDRRERFVGGAIVAAWGVWAALVVANPGAIIVRANVARLGEGRVFDVHYLSSLGHDAAPAIAAALPRMSANDACLARRALARDEAGRVAERESGWRDWRAWSVAGWRAERAWRRAGARPVLAHRECPHEAGARAARGGAVAVPDHVAMPRQ